MWWSQKANDAPEACLFALLSVASETDVSNKLVEVAFVRVVVVAKDDQRLYTAAFDGTTERNTLPPFALGVALTAFSFAATASSSSVNRRP
ncbi:hypothetical protein EVAR_37160_1 [Eumeta japonica]|uniref:Uncharacterized protein n=1 Tax=Eumeta variegata TaxID=151549 RepID=A0A4C1WJ13_EUMVA|nr:hypothetical protein EVAR_37160_1 [Eumeta japonica]